MGQQEGGQGAASRKFLGSIFLQILFYLVLAMILFKFRFWKALEIIWCQWTGEFNNEGDADMSIVTHDHSLLWGLI